MLRRIVPNIPFKRALSHVPIDDHFFGLNDEEIELRYTFRRFFEKEIPPKLAKQIDADDHYPEYRQFIKKCADMGILGLAVPEEYGGTNLGVFAACIAGEEFARVHAGLSMFVGAHTQLATHVIEQNGSTEQKERFLPDMVSGNKIGALAMSEPNSGSDVMSMRLSAVKKGDHYVLNGNKFWITNGPVCDTLVVYAKTDPTSNGGNSLTAFILDTNTEGFTAKSIPGKLGYRGSDTGDLHFDNVAIPADNVLIGEGMGAFVLMRGLNMERVTAAPGPIGIMQAVCDTAFPYAHDRKQFGRPIGKFQLIQGKMAEMYSTLAACRAFTYTTIRAAERDDLTNHDCAALLLYVSEAATKVALDGIQILGGNGYINDYPTGRFLRDAKLMEIGAGTTEIRKLILGRHFNDLYSEN